MSTRFTRIAGWCGVLAPLVMTFTTFAAITRAPWFSWGDNGLSALGISNTSTLFNGGLISGGLLNIIFAIGLARWHRPYSRLAAFAGGLLIAGGAGLLLVGVFPDNAGRIHDVVSITYFLATTFACAMWGIVWLQSGEKVRGILSIAAAAAALFTLIAAPHRRLATAVPSLLAATIINCWIFALAVNLIIKPQDHTVKTA